MRLIHRCPSKHGREFEPLRVLSVELTDGIADLNDLHGYRHVLLLVRLDGRPVGSLVVPCDAGRLEAARVRAALEAHAGIVEQVTALQLRQWLLQHHPQPARPMPSWSVVVCTRNRVEQLGRCVEALLAARTGEGEVLVVDNDPPNDQTRQLVARYPVRYLREPRRGLNWARACGARAARGAIVLYTDDDVVVDRRWIAAMMEPFDGPRVAAVTGLTMPLELETPAQLLFECYGGHQRGFARRVFDESVIPPAAAGRVGSGANMAFRQAWLQRLGLFDCELDAGTAAQSGGDAYAFYQVLRGGYQIVYTPEALVWHQHRRDYPALRQMLHGYSVGVLAFLTRCLVQHRDGQALQIGMSWLRHHHVRQLRRALLRRPDALPIDLILAEWRGVFKGPGAYLKTRRAERTPPRRYLQEAVSVEAAS